MTCQLVCSFHHAKIFSPELSSIKIIPDNISGEMQVSIEPSCDLFRTLHVAHAASVYVFGVPVHAPVIPAQAGIQRMASDPRYWSPACAGMT